MTLSIEHQFDPKAASLLIHIDGEFKGVNAVDFEHDILSEIRTGRAKTVLFDLSKTSYMDSAAIEFLFQCASICKEGRQSIRLTQPKDNIRKLLSILRVDRMIPID